MIRHFLLAAAFVAGMIAAAQAQFAGDYPDLSMDSLRAANMQQDAAFMQMNANFCQQWYLQRRAYRAATGDYGYIPGPVSTQDLVDSNRRLQAQYDRNNLNYHDRSRREMDAVGRFADQGILGNVPHVNPQTDFRTILPYGPAHYNIDPYDVARPGFDPRGFNVEPDYGYGYQPW